jgi:hypothetical protein
MMWDAGPAFSGLVWARLLDRDSSSVWVFVFRRRGGYLVITYIQSSIYRLQYLYAVVLVSQVCLSIPLSYELSAYNRPSINGRQPYANVKRGLMQPSSRP